MDSLMQFFIIRDKKTHGIAPFIGTNAESGPRSKNILEPLIGVFYADTSRASIHYLCGIRSQSIILHLEKDHVVDSLYGEHDCSALFFGRDPILDRILDKGLKYHRWNLHIKTGKINLLDKFQPVAKAHLLDSDIVVDKIKFMDQFHHLVAMGIKGVPEYIRQLGNNLPRLFIAGADEGVDGIEGVEKEVRIDLRLQRSHLHFAILDRKLTLLLCLILRPL